MTGDDITRLPARAIAAAVADRRLSAAEVTAAFLARIDAVNGAVNAVCTLNPRAAEDAAAVDARLAAGEPARPLDGVPFVVKDIIHTKDLRTTFGSLICADEVPADDAVAVARLRAAGGILLGKSNTPEFAHDVNTSNKLFGPTRNPWDLRRTSGGSSGGTAAAVAAGMAPLGIGTDLGGSIRIPSALCGTAGLRPAPGRVPAWPSEFAWDTLVQHVQGPMAADIGDLGLMLSVMAGPDDRDPSTLPGPVPDYAAAAATPADLTGRRIAYARDLGGLVPLDGQVGALADAAARAFADLGAVVEDAFFDTSDLPDIIAGTRAFGMVARYADRFDAHRDVMTPPLINQVTAALDFDVRAITRAERLRTRYWHRVREFMADYDFILAPSATAPAFRLDQPLPTEVGGQPVERFYDVFLPCYAFSVTALPVAAIPCGLTSDGLPAGLQLVAPRQREDLALSAAAAYAAACPQHFQRPDIDLTQAVDLGQEITTPGIHIG